MVANESNKDEKVKKPSYLIRNYYKKKKQVNFDNQFIFYSINYDETVKSMLGFKQKLINDFLLYNLYYLFCMYPIKKGFKLSNRKTGFYFLIITLSNYYTSLSSFKRNNNILKEHIIMTSMYKINSNIDLFK